MKASVPRRRCDTASTVSMYHDVIDTIVVVINDDTDTLTSSTTPATSAESSPKQPYTPHLISPDNIMAPLPGTPKLTKGAHHHRRLSSNSSIASYGSSLFGTSPPPTIPNFSSLVISVEEIENEESPMRRKQQQLKPPPARHSGCRSHRPTHIDPSSCKVTRYSVGVLGERSYSAEKPSWKMMRRTAVAPMRRAKSDKLAARRGVHRRDSFASLPRLSDIGIVKEDLVDAVMGMTPTSTRTQLFSQHTR
eukprot:CAMPEP_0119027898 /NCGR_PEP_ID=MMETSP1176-20130426/37937_1 /TAXON_ID=265551 /ORGANISM="Synedropsis recta cf, Strain CCMP1620" /LENGTH=248 /DNA_ID=CAMNT_0006983917 /DNA_START=152 /DNA_END=898 /DNA_ORIENTATION=+